MKKLLGEKTDLYKKGVFGALKDNRSESQKNKHQEVTAITQLACYLMKKVFTILKIRRDKKQNLRSIGLQAQAQYHQRLKQRVVKEIVDAYVIEPRLDAIGEKHYLRKQLLTFKKKVEYVRDRDQG